jgi:peroxin-11B
MSSINDRVVRLTSALSRISSSCFMVLDHIVCLHKLGLLPANLIDPASWDRTSAKFWLYSIILGIIRDVYEINRIHNEYQMRWKQKKGRRSVTYGMEDSKSSGGIGGTSHFTVQCVMRARVASKYITDHADVAIDTLKNSCDLFIPLNALGVVKLSPGTIGFLGVISTIASAIPQINPMVKMVPAS